MEIKLLSIFRPSFSQKGSNYISTPIVYEYILIDILNEPIKFVQALSHALIFQADLRAVQDFPSVQTF